MYLTMFIFAVIFPFECEHLVDNAVHREAGQVNKSHQDLCVHLQENFEKQDYDG